MQKHDLLLTYNIPSSSCNILCFITYHNVPQCKTMYHNVLQCTTMYHNVPQCTTMDHNGPQWTHNGPTMDPQWTHKGHNVEVNDITDSANYLGWRGQRSRGPKLLFSFQKTLRMIPYARAIFPKTYLPTFWKKRNSKNVVTTYRKLPQTTS